MALVVNTLDTGSDEATHYARTELQTKLAWLQLEIAESDLLVREQEEQMEALQAELLQADLEFGELQEDTGQTIESLLEQQPLLETTARRALLTLGTAAVPVLVDLLAEELANIRGWSARLLGEIGTAAADAEPELMKLLSDPDEAVRRQARQSLSDIKD